jgi:hypothetical protein
MQWQGYGIGRHRGIGLLTQHVAYASEQINQRLIQNITSRFNTLALIKTYVIHQGKHLI